MSEWKEVRLGDLIEVKYGKDHKKLGNGTIPIYGSGGVMRTGDLSLYDQPSVLIPRKGTLSNIFYVDTPFWTVDTMFWTKVNTEKVLPKFLYYSIKDYKWDSLNVGSAVPSLTVPVIEDVSITLPSLDTQKKIVAQLSEIDNKIAVNKKICENLEAQAQALFKHWFVDFAPFKDGKFVESELGLIPEGLVYKRIEDIPHTLETGKRPSGGVKGIDRGIPSIGAENIKGLGCYDFSKTKYITEEYASTMKKGIINGYELLIYKDGGKPGYFIPNFAIFGEGYPYDKMCLNEHVFKLDFGNKGYSLFAYFYFKTKQIMSYLNAQGAKAAIPGINSKDIDAIMMPSLDNECVKQYCSEVEDFITQILVLGKESSRLASLRDTLLPKLMSGQIKL